jgi:hypothetical protein
MPTVAVTMSPSCDISPRPRFRDLDPPSPPVLPPGRSRRAERRADKAHSHRWPKPSHERHPSPPGRQTLRLPRREELAERLLRLGGQLIRAEKLEAVAADSDKDSFTLQLPQNTPRHLAAGSHEPGQLCPGQDDFLLEAQGPMLFENPKHSEPCVLM